MRSVALAAALTLLAPCGASLAAPSYSFVTLDVPGSISTGADGINSRGQIVGNFLNASSVNEGFLFDPASGDYTVVSYSNQMFSGVFGINNLEQVAGFADLSERYPYPVSSFVFNSASGSLTILPNASATQTQATGINDSGQIVGTLQNAQIPGVGHVTYGYSFLRDPVTGNYTYEHLFGDTYFEGINNSGKIVGYYTTPTAAAFGSSFGGTDHGFVLNPTTGIYSLVDDPLAVPPNPNGDPTPAAGGTNAYGINDLGQIVGDYVANIDSRNIVTYQDFIYDPASNTYTDLSYPEARETDPRGINNAGEIVGSYTDASGVDHGFIATPVLAAVPEPSSLILLGISTSCIWLTRRERLGHVVRRARALFDGVLA